MITGTLTCELPTPAISPFKLLKSANVPGFRSRIEGRTDILCSAPTAKFSLASRRPERIVSRTDREKSWQRGLSSMKNPTVDGCLRSSNYVVNSAPLNSGTPATDERISACETSACATRID